ncbi:MAG: DUF998 domain-containing protein [Gaiellaceae bacterium]
MPTRAAGVCALLALLTISVGWIAGAVAQPDAYSSADDDTSDLGALTASRAWIYNQIGDNLTGILVVLFGLGLWRALSPDVLGRIGAGAVILTGLGAFLDGVFRLDCRGIDRNCTKRLMALLGAQDGDALHRGGDDRRAVHPRVRLSPPPEVARRLAANALRRASIDRLRRHLLHPR